ncbi:PGPGW domain-containing protein [Candidatus Saccharibacteria bacterium]|nr:PGPGW domain-containing protein [Candidatus Saccharibacteria bacterium]
MKKIAKLVRKIAVAAVGFVVLAIGLILIPLPGPGILITLAGLFILSLEFTWAEKHLDRAKNAANKVVEKAKAKNNKPPKILD